MNKVTVVFDMATILTVICKRLYAPSIKNLYEILNYMTGDKVFTHQLIRIADEMTPVILAQYPDLQELVETEKETVTEENFKEFLTDAIQKYGNEFPIIPCGLFEHKVIDPQEEMEQMMKGREDKIFIIDPDNFTQDDD